MNKKNEYAIYNARSCQHEKLKTNNRRVNSTSQIIRQRLRSYFKFYIL